MLKLISKHICRAGLRARDLFASLYNSAGSVALPARYMAAILALMLSSLAFAQTPYNKLQYPPLHPVQIPEVKRVVLNNGMILFLIEDHELPLISMSARIGCGSIDEPADKVGLAGITGSVIRTGGTATMPGDQIDEKLESIAASVETGISLNSGFASMSVLKENVDTGLGILADILMHPAFPEAKLELAKVQARTAISRRNDDPEEIASREFDALIYGKNSVFARDPQYSTIDAITRDDLVAFHKKYFYPNNVMLAAWGDFQTADMVQKIEAAFGKWEKGPVTRPKPPQVNYQFDYTVNLVSKEDVNQSTILIGHLGGLLNDPNYPAMEVLNTVIGAESGRLFNRVRSQQGLAYSVTGTYDANFDYPGEFYVEASTKSETTVRAIESMLHEMDLLRKEEITDEELATAKDSYLNSFVFNYDTKSEIVNRLMRYEYYGYPKDFLEQTKAGVEKVTKADVLRVAQQYLHPDKVRILVVGNDKEFGEPLSKLGKVNAIDITIPEEKSGSSSQ